MHARGSMHEHEHGADAMGKRVHEHPQVHPHEPGHGAASACGHTHGALPRVNRNGRDAAARVKERRGLLWAAGIAVAVMVLEVVGAWFTNSIALLSDAGHMFTDASAVFLSLLALWMAERPHRGRWTFGYHRLEILAALANALLLLGLAAVVVYHAIGRLQAPPVVETVPMLAWAGAGLVANLVSVAILWRSQGSLNTRSAFLHVLFDTLSSVLVMVGAAVMYLTGWFWLDAALSCVLSLFIAATAVRLLREAVDVLLQAVPRDLDVNAVRRALLSTSGVLAVRDLHVWSLTCGVHVLSAQVVVRDQGIGHHDSVLRRAHEALRCGFGIEHATLQLQSEDFVLDDENIDCSAEIRPSNSARS